MAAGDFELTGEELRAVAKYATGFAQDVLPVFEQACVDDVRPRKAIDAALRFIRGEPRSKLQRTMSLDAHRAAKEAPDPAARLAAQAAGDAAAAAYLHPIAKATQVGHILRAAASAAHIAELQSGGDDTAARKVIADAVTRASPILIDVLSRYPVAASATKNRTMRLMAVLDAQLRSAR